MTQHTWTPEEDYYKRMGWCSCPECDRVYYDWEQFVVHAESCVYGTEQGVQLSKLKFTHCISSN